MIGETHTTDEVDLSPEALLRRIEYLEHALLHLEIMGTIRHTEEDYEEIRRNIIHGKV